MKAAELDMFTIYERPKFHPKGYAVRRTLVGEAECRCLPCEASRPHDTCALKRTAALVKDLSAARAMVPLGKSRLPRGRGEDRSVLEVWV